MRRLLIPAALLAAGFVIGFTWHKVSEDIARAWAHLDLEDDWWGLE